MVTWHSFLKKAQFCTELESLVAKRFSNEKSFQIQSLENYQMDDSDLKSVTICIFV